MIRLGLCCIFRDQPIKFRTTTAAAISRMKRADGLVKLSTLCLANADALLASLQFCADNGIGCFRINSRILPLKTHPECGYLVDDLPEGVEIVRRFNMCGGRSYGAGHRHMGPGTHVSHFQSDRRLERPEASTSS